jgi:Fe2+ transport system protein FeoA
MTHTLASLRPGQSAVITGITTHGAVAQRLMHLGIVEGMEVEFIRRAPTGDPIEIRVMGYELSLRNDEADTVNVEIRD